MLCDIEQLKKFLAQVERVGKIEWSRGANGDVDSNVATNEKTKMDGKDVVEKKKFEDISKQYNKKENNIHDVRNDGKKSEKTKKKIDRIVEKKKEKMPEKKNNGILFECGKLKEIKRKKI